MKTAKKIHSKHHLYSVLSRAHKRLNSKRVIKLRTKNEDTFIIDLRDDFAEEDVKNLENKLCEIKNKIKEYSLEKRKNLLFKYP